MSDEPEPVIAPEALEETSDEHPLSLLLFSGMRGRGFDRFLLVAVSVLCVLLAVLDLLIGRHPTSMLDGLPVFFGVFGFLSFGLAVLSGWPLGRLLRRPETYYDPDVATPDKERRDD